MAKQKYFTGNNQKILVVCRLKKILDVLSVTCKLSIFIQQKNMRGVQINKNLLILLVVHVNDKKFGHFSN